MQKLFNGEYLNNWQITTSLDGEPLDTLQFWEGKTHTDSYIHYEGQSTLITSGKKMLIMDDHDKIMYLTKNSARKKPITLSYRILENLALSLDSTIKKEGIELNDSTKEEENKFTVIVNPANGSLERIEFFEQEPDDENTGSKINIKYVMVLVRHDENASEVKRLCNLENYVIKASGSADGGWHPASAYRNYEFYNMYEQ